MKRKTKGIFTALLCAAMMISAVPSYSVCAADTAKSENAETTEMRKAITEVKKRIDIPSDYTEFDYSVNTKYNVSYYNFKWYKKGDQYRKYLTVNYYNGFISSYELSGKGTSSGKASFGKLSVQKQDELAKKYLYKLNPDLKGNAVITRDSAELSLFGNSVRYSVSREENGIDFKDNYGSITIDRDTGELLKYSLKWWSSAVIPDASKKLSVQKVSDIYASRKPLKAYYDLFYKSEYDIERKEYISTPFVLAVYAPAVGGENEIDAITGKYTSYYDDRKKFSYTDAYDWNDYDYDEECEEEVSAEAADDDDDEYYLSDAEKKALEEENKYMSYEEALKIIKNDPYIVFNKELVLSSNNLGRYTDDNGDLQVSRDLSFRYTTQDITKDSVYLDVKLDAYTGKIISFSKRYSYGYNSPNKNTKMIDVKASSALAQKAAKHYIGKKADEYKYDGNVNAVNTKDYVTTQGTFCFTRYVNGLPTSFDDMRIGVDSRGEILSFSHTYHNIKFPKAELVSEKEAYEKLFKNMKPELYYNGFTDLQLKPHVYLTYRFESNYYINAVTGERINYYGEPYYSKESKQAETKEAKLYADIKGHKYEKEITALWNYGVRISGRDKLDPDGAITMDEFMTLKCQVMRGASASSIYPDQRVYSKEKRTYEYIRDKRRDKTLTYGELAKIYVYCYASEYYKAAELHKLFLPPYKNVDSKNEYCGYIAIAKDQGFISGGDEFPYNKTLTRAQCYKYFYDYVAGSSEKKLYEAVKI